MKQLAFEKVNGWGGARQGAGRPRLGKQVNHLARPKVKANVPLHVTMRLKPNLKTLRSKNLLRKFRRSAASAGKFGLAINHFSLQGNHLHMICEAKNNRAVASGMRSFGGSFGRAVRRINGGRGGVFDGRYHVTPVTTPTQYRSALTYVLLNRARHTKRAPAVDRYSSGTSFEFWRELIGRSFVASADAIARPRSWVATVGWRCVEAGIDVG